MKSWETRNYSATAKNVDVDQNTCFSKPSEGHDQVDANLEGPLVESVLDKLMSREMREEVKLKIKKRNLKGRQLTKEICKLQ